MTRFVRKDDWINSVQPALSFRRRLNSAMADTKKRLTRENLNEKLSRLNALSLYTCPQGYFHHGSLPNS